jgi:hypothetical protein
MPMHTRLRSMVGKPADGRITTTCMFEGLAPTWDISPCARNILMESNSRTYPFVRNCSTKLGWAGARKRRAHLAGYPPVILKVSFRLWNARL